MYKTIIKNGTIIDGTGREMFRGDVGIKDDRIAEIGNLQNERAENFIDARGKFVAPGFVDINNRSDIFWQIFQNPELQSLIYQGVTTIIGGNCGLSLAPLAGKETIDFVQRWNGARKTNLNWLEMGDFLKTVEKTKLSVNFGTLIGQNTIRFDLLSGAKRELEATEMKRAEKMILSALQSGSLGLSTLIGNTGHKKYFSQEMLSFAKLMAEKGVVYSVGLTGKNGSDVISELSEALEIATASGAKLHLSHVQMVGEKNWKKQDEVLALLEQAVENGTDISFDFYPYQSAGVELEEFLPLWATEGSKKIMLARLKDKEDREKIIQEMKATQINYSRVIINLPSIDKKVRRRSISELALSQKKSAEDVILDILTSRNGYFPAMAEALSEENLEKVMAHPFSIVASNDSGYGIEYQKSGDFVHPRSFGTFPKVLAEYVREKKILSWEQAICKMTEKPARRFGISERGSVEKGKMADLIVFDGEKITDRSSESNPFQYAEGVEWVLVNGEIVLQEGKFNGKREGRIVR
jgi:N-acyl-D-aspartate/D-glutamate deacylase